MEATTSPETQQRAGATVTGVLVALLLAPGFLHCSIPAQADTTPAETQSAETSPAATSSAGASTIGQKMFKSNSKSTRSCIARIPMKLFAFTVGTAVGTPIALARCTHRELIRQTKEAYTLGGAPKPFGYITAPFFGIPSGILCGTWYGISDGVADSWVNSKDASLTRGALSLEKLAF